MNEKTIFLLMFLVSSALLIYVEYAGVEDGNTDQNVTPAVTRP